MPVDRSCWGTATAHAPGRCGGRGGTASCDADDGDDNRVGGGVGKGPQPSPQSCAGARVFQLTAGRSAQWQGRRADGRRGQGGRGGGSSSSSGRGLLDGAGQNTMLSKEFEGARPGPRTISKPQQHTARSPEGQGGGAGVVGGMRCLLAALAPPAIGHWGGRSKAAVGASCARPLRPRRPGLLSGPPAACASCIDLTRLMD